MKNNIFLFGFPKCGTSTIWNFFKDSLEYNVLQPDGNLIEYNILTSLKKEHKKSLYNGRCFLKYSSAALNKKTSKNIHARCLEFGKPIYLLSTRRPGDALKSWYSMHKRIALEGTNAGHFAVMQREKYQSISIEEYSHEFIDKVNYASMIKQFARIVDPCTVYILDFRRAKDGINSVAGRFLEETENNRNIPPEFGNRNKGNYNKSSIHFTEDIATQLNVFEKDLDMLLSNLSGIIPNCKLGHYQ